MESIYDAREGKVERPKPHDSKDIRRIDDEFVLCDRHDRWDTIDSEYEIGCLDKYETHKERCSIELRIFADEKCITMKFFFERDDFAHPFYHETMLRIDLHLTTSYELICSIEEDRSKYVDDPVEVLKKWYSSKYEYHAEK